MMDDDPFSHFVIEGEGAYVGKHAIIEMWGVESHTDETLIQNNFVETCKKIGATVLFSHIHPFGPNCGTTGVIILAESHLSWHHYPECGYIAIDIFVCGDLNPENGFENMKNFWNPSSFEFKTMKRGQIQNREQFKK